MKLIFKVILKYYLKYIAKLALLLYRPVIIVVAGSINKEFIKQEIVDILKKQGKNVRANHRNYNTEIGLPLAVLNLSSGYNSYKKWLPIILKAPLAVFQGKYPKYLVLELGVSKLGDMKHLLSIIKPKIAIISDITQRYLESFNNIDLLVGEYEYLARKLRKDNLTLLNNDNRKVEKLADLTKAKVKFFGFNNNEYKILEINRGEQGQIIQIKQSGQIEKYKINRFGNHHAYALLAGLIIKKYITKEDYEKKN
jgi:UDP-N-acetylmuramoyl-tripeptide--D-alanyl-D-alanine ligase